jgi:hypothetical protein
MFVEAPPHWGMRGDPYLWDELKGTLSDVALPSTSAGLSQLIGSAFESSTGHAMDERGYFVIERFAHGGMSSGGISTEFWRDTAMPLLLERYRKARGQQS